MKIKILGVIALSYVIFLTGCAAFYGNEKQYAEGDWYGIAGSHEVAHIKSDKLAFEKLKAEPAQTKFINGVQQGYKGVVVNLSNQTIYEFRIIGLENKSYLLGPGDRTEDYLVPGNYTYIIYRGKRKVRSGSFHVGPQQSEFFKEKYHWYVYIER